jgi:hypothetical protein
VADAHVVLILVEDEFLVLFVDGVVGQMHADVLHVVFVWGDVGFSGEAAEAFAEDEHAEGIDSSKQNIDSEIEFQALDEIGFAQISLHNAMLLRVDVIQFTS